ncbi:hypothetical protein [Devosia sp.]|uniref:hypothetical protein n=1 Tax=Devosia sp. TaxID=1871048 RepID=UPI00273675F0|nr:hypothetical protein [Devosia sp.]
MAYAPDAEGYRFNLADPEQGEGDGVPSFVDRDAPAEVIRHGHAVCVKRLLDISPCQVTLAPTSSLARFANDPFDICAGSTDC